MLTRIQQTYFKMHCSAHNEIRMTLQCQNEDRAETIVASTCKNHECPASVSLIVGSWSLGL